jgi:hypothetical protein
MNQSSFSFTDIKTQYENSINPKIHLLNIFTIIFNRCYFTQEYGQKLLTCLNDHNKYFNEINKIISNTYNNFKKIQEEKQIILYLYLFIDNFFDSQQKEKIKQIIDNIQKNVLASKPNEIQPFYKLIKEKNESIFQIRLDVVQTVRAGRLDVFVRRLDTYDAYDARNRAGMEYQGNRLDGGLQLGGNGV